MRLWNLRILGVSLLGCVAFSVLAGVLYAWLAHKLVWFGIGTALFLVGLLALALGFLGAAEPAGGWATNHGRRTGRAGRRSLAARVAGDVPEDGEISSWELAVWAVVVGGGSVVLAMAAFALSS